MRIRVAGAAAALVISAACGSSPTTVSTVGTASPDAHRPVAERQAAVYTAILRRYLTSADSSFGAKHKWPVVYVIDRAVPGAANPERVDKGAVGETIPSTVQAAMLEDLRGVAPLRFVASRRDVLSRPDSGSSCQQVMRDGILITLAPVAQIGDRVEVGVNGYVDCLAATWLTYVVERGAGGWHVTGTTGPRAIS